MVSWLSRPLAPATTGASLGTAPPAAQLPLEVRIDGERAVQAPLPAVAGVHHVHLPALGAGAAAERMVEVHLHAGDGLRLHLISPDGAYREIRLGADATAKPQAVVPAGTWMAAEPVNATGYALVGCTVAPPFQFEAFELAPDGWEPG